jgi:hypothetical protein
MNATTTVHVNYPHTPGTLYDCPPCEARMARTNLRSTITMYFGDEDEYGTTLGWHFAIAELLTLLEFHHDIPAAWQFRAAPGLDSSTWAEDSHENSELWELWQTGEISADALIYWGNVLSRYADVLRAAGLDY